MAVYTALDRRTAAHLVEGYGIGRVLKLIGIPAGSVNTHYLLETTKGAVFLKIDEVKTAAEVQREIDLLLSLRAHGFSCPQPVADRNGQYLQEYHDKPVSLSLPLSGHARLVPELTGAHLYNAGQALASLHQLGQGVGKDIENRFSFSRLIDMYLGLKEKLPGYFKHLIHTLEDEVTYQQQYQEDRLPKGVIHGDLFADNILFRGEKVIGLLDFEAACHGKLIFDVSTAINALCYHDGRYDIERFEAFLKGYQRVRALSLAEWDAFPNELRFSAFRFTITRLKDFFLRPMEEKARVNKDFRDFFERLQVLRRERQGGMDRLLLAMATGYDYRQYQKVPAPKAKTEGRKGTESARIGGRQRTAKIQRKDVRRRVRTAR